MFKRNSFIIGAAAALALAAFVSCGNAQESEPGVAIVAHRGFHACEAGGGARNSVAALKAAQDNYFWGAELDVNMTSDEVVLVHHDGVIDGKSFNDYPHSEFAEYRLENGETIPTLDEYLAQASKSKNTVVVLEVKWHKTPEMEDRCIEICIDLLKKYKMFDPNRVIFISFSIHACKSLVAMAPGYTVQYLGNDMDPDAVFAEGVNGMDTNYWTLFRDSTWVPRTKAHGMSMNAWTVNDREDMKKVIALGIDQLTTDHPDVAREVLAEMGIPEKFAGKKPKALKK